MLPSGSLTSPVTGNLHQEPTLSLTSVPSARIFSSHGEKDRGSQWQAFNLSLEHRLEGLPSILDFPQICKDDQGFVCHHELLIS